MSEQLAFDQGLRQRAGVHRDERLATPRTQLVNRLCDELFAGAAFAFDDHRARNRRDLLDLEQHFVDGVALSDQSRRLGESLAVENSAHGQIQLVGGDRLGIDIGEAERAQTRAQLGVLDVGEADHRCPAPQLVADDLEVDRIAEIPGEDDEIGLEAFDLAAQVVEG